MADFKKFLLCSALPISLVACSTEVQIVHDPLIATSGDQITFTANAITNATPDSLQIQLLVNAVLVKTCTSSPCTFTGGPYPSREDGFVTYAANITAEYEFLGIDWTYTNSDGYYHTGITDGSYDFSGSDYLYARYSGDVSDKEDLVFHMAPDYDEDLEALIEDATDKVNDVLGAQALIENNLDKFNFWIYKKEAEAATGCGTVHDDAASDMPWRDVDAVLHIANFGDCTNAGLTHFSAEGSNTKAFLHEAGHAVFGLGDEYDGNTNYSIVQSPEPNIFSTEAECQAEQTSKSRDPSECYEFTSRMGGWWSIHSGTTVMTTGNVGDDWDTEAEERVLWYFGNM